eukprot:CAMPEP_0197824386 /NCGR_PEP_ID=MMETSP1437-20131217/1640_1 /TAXON_ID=49252 ORGANISM="Eucampia antarctica, Strain CCMP1452" /NCGR_SAMPLE_ID=MMETSP1437 /ASSEMBLY_ACC=CAM_ASM_001096 /LENGTH=85 /DNA_ID=CAMNT_0043423993 /DNA_START=415 /DNA_END=672 /DNA_ORIENTATION=+
MEDDFFTELISVKDANTWRRLERLNTLAWVGSVIAGGILADEHSYYTTYLLSSIVQGVGILVLLLAAIVMPKNNVTNTDSKEELR